MTENLIESAGTPAPVGAAGSNPAQVAVGDNLFATLGLGNVESDPNAVPDGWYDATVRSASIVHIKSKNGVSAVLNYALEGDYAPAQFAQFQNMGINPVIEDGKVKAFTPTMSEKNKTYLKKAFTDLGITEDEVISTPTEALLAKVVGRKCRVRVVKGNQGYRNVVDVQHVPSEVPTSLSATTTEAPAPSTTDEPPF